MKIIELTQGQVSLVDAEFKPSFKYYAAWFRNGFRAVRECRVGTHRKMRFLQHDVLGLPIENPPQVDHRNGNPLDNRKKNLRLLPGAKNLWAFQTKRKNVSSVFRGVSWSPTQGKWRARVTKLGAITHVGYYRSEVAAARARDRKALQLFGTIAQLNFPK
jgi:hypothetical protein